jgi:hypothetical protein
MRTPEEIARGLCIYPETGGCDADGSCHAHIVDEIRRDRAAQAALVLPLVKRALGSRYEENEVRMFLSPDEFVAAEQWLAEAEKEATKRCAVPTAKEERAKS